jgi:catechol 2,3-dioxygenase-like lactoylglutathione lyase family enzyme
MLGNTTLTAFVATSNPDRCKRFYEELLGLRLVTDDQFALTFECNGAELRIQKVQKLQPQPFTALGWKVTGIRDLATALAAKGIEFERYSFLPQDDRGIWTAPGGTQVAWFKDPDGNLLSLSESPLTT